MSFNLFRFFFADLTRTFCFLFCLSFVHGCAVTAPAGNEQQPGLTDPETEASEPPSGGDFTLHSIKGPVSLHDFKGKVVLLFFGYANCPDVCPTSLAFSTKALNTLNKDELAQVQPLFVSIDPQRDSVEKLAEFVTFFHSKFIGLTGSENEIRQVARLYGVKYYQVELEGSASGYAVNHSAAVYLITQDGTLRFLFPHGTSPALIVKAIRYLLTNTQ